MFDTKKIVGLGTSLLLLGVTLTACSSEETRSEEAFCSQIDRLGTLTSQAEEKFREIKEPESNVFGEQFIPNESQATEIKDFYTFIWEISEPYQKESFPIFRKLQGTVPSEKVEAALSLFIQELKVSYSTNDKQLLLYEKINTDGSNLDELDEAYENLDEKYDEFYVDLEKANPLIEENYDIIEDYVWETCDADFFDIIIMNPLGERYSFFS